MRANKILNTDAAFDTLVITSKLQRELMGVAAADLHLFSYLACLLWLYKRHALDDWGYSFMGTELGAPFSREVNDAIEQLAACGHLLEVKERLRVSSIAEERLRTFLDLRLNQERIECLHAACASTSAFSLGIIGSALAHEPELKRARSVDVTRQLLEGWGRSQLYHHFEALRKGLLKDDVDLRVPAVVWLAALYKSGEQAPL